MRSGGGGGGGGGGGDSQLSDERDVPLTRSLAERATHERIGEVLRRHLRHARRGHDAWRDKARAQDAARAARHARAFGGASGSRRIASAWRFARPSR